MVDCAVALHPPIPAARIAAALCVSSCLLLSGCFAPRHERPEHPGPQEYPAEYRDAEHATVTPVAATELSWRKLLLDPRLVSLVDTALTHNRNLAVAVARIDEAQGLYRIQRSQRLPNLDASASGTRNRSNASALSGGLSPGASIDQSVRYERYSLTANVASFELDFWGRVRNLSDAARAEYLATLAAARAFRLSLIRDVASAHLQSLELSERVKLAEATVHSREEGLRIAQRRLEAGVTSALDFRQTQTLLTQAETDLAALRLAKAQADNLLLVLVGRPIDGALPDPLPLDEQISEEPLGPGLPSQLLVMRPDVVAAEERLRAARANIGAARAAFLPTIALTGSYGYASNALGDLVGEDGVTWSYGPVISVPLFDFGRRQANLDVAKAREHIAIATYELTLQTAFQEVANALAGRRYLAQQVDAQERNTMAQRRLANLARLRYREGVVSYLEVLDAERNLFAAEQALLQVRRAEAENLVALYVALGGGEELP